MVEKISKPAAFLGLILGLMLPVLAIAGFTLHELVSRAFTHIEQVETAERLNAKALSLQLDLETGIRGYINTEDPVFLEPWHVAVSQTDENYRLLRQAIINVGLPEYTGRVDDAQRTSHIWRVNVAGPFLRLKHPRQGMLQVTHARQKYGKMLVDRIRNDLYPITYGLADIRRQTAEDARSTVDRIGFFVLAVVVVSGLLGYLFLADRAKLARDLDLAEEARVLEQHRLELEQRRLEEEQQRLAIALATEKRIAETLQEALSQRPLPNLPTVHFSAMYMPAAEQTKVGGDWYDAIELSTSRALFVIGDVAGHGIDAAVGMSRARQEFIGAALRNPDPSSMLRRVNSELVREGSPMVTAVCGVADAARYEFTVATAGHPPPVLLEPGRPPRILECGGLPLGIIPASEYMTYTVQTVPGALLVLYTDGAIEHSHSVLEGEALLLQATSTCLEQAEVSPATAIHRGIFQNRSAGDDVAILTIGFAVEQASGMKISVERLQNSLHSHLRGTVSQAPQNKAISLMPRLARRIAGNQGRRVA